MLEQAEVFFEVLNEADGFHAVFGADFAVDLAYMVLDGLGGDEEAPGDVGVAESFGHELEDFFLPGAEEGDPFGAFEVGVLFGFPLFGAAAGNEVGQEVGGELNDAVMGGFDGGGEVFHGGVLENVADGAVFQCLVHVVVVLEGCEHEDSGAGEFGAYGSGGFYAVHDGHADVHENDVEGVVLGPLDGLEAVFNDAAYGEAAESGGENGLKALGEEVLIVDDEQFDFRHSH